MTINRRNLLFALLASPFAVAAAHAAPGASQSTPVIPDIPDNVPGSATRSRRRRAENHDESHHGRERHHSRRRSRRHHDGDDD